MITLVAPCAECKIFTSIHGLEYAKKYNDARFIIVLCRWFARNCSSAAASNTFKRWGVRASPTTLFFYVRNGKIVVDTRREGVLNRDKLIMAYTLFRELALKCKM